MPHIVLLGDSIFDNAAYTNGGSDVIARAIVGLACGVGRAVPSTRIVIQ